MHMKLPATSPKIIQCAEVGCLYVCLYQHGMTSTSIFLVTVLDVTSMTSKEIISFSDCLAWDHQRLHFFRCLNSDSCGKVATINLLLCGRQVHTLLTFVTLRGPKALSLFPFPLCCCQPDLFVCHFLLAPLKEKASIFDRIYPDG